MSRKRNSAARRGLRRRLFHEALECRRLLIATDLASVSGLVFDDFSGNGFDLGEEVSGATLTLHRDDGDGTFEQGTDTQVDSVVTDADGGYVFNRVTAGGYFVLQDTQTVDGTTLQRSVSPLIVFTDDEVAGTIVTPIDTFDETSQVVTDISGDGVPETLSVDAPEVIGGQRDIYVNLTSATGSISLSANDTVLGLGGLLSFGSQGNGAGERRVSWDGQDDDALTIQDNGLGATDLTSGGAALGLQLQIGADLPGGEVDVRLYSDDGNSGTSDRHSTATLVIPQTGGIVSQKEFIPFSSFAPTGSDGGADFTQIGAIELEILTANTNVDGQADIVGTVGETDKQFDFSNFEQADLSLDKTIDNASPDIGENVVFTVTLTNSGPDAATNVVVQDSLPDGVTFVSANASAGTYDPNTGEWTVATVGSGTSPTLQLTGRIESSGSRFNYAQVSESDQFDTDSTPGNGQPEEIAEDDEARVAFVTESIDLELQKTAEPSTVVVGSNVTFTLTLTNQGPDRATGVVVRDQLPTGIVYVSDSASRGTYDSATSQWTVGEIAADETVTLSLVGRVDVPGPKTNTAEVISADQLDVDSTPDNNVAAEDDQDSVTIEAPQIDLSLTKAANPSTVVVGENVTFTINVSNAGPSQATGVTVLDQLPAGIEFQSFTASQGDYNNATGIWDVGSMASGGNVSLTLVGRVTVPGPKTNVAQVQSADQPDADSTPGNSVDVEDDQESVTIQAPQIDLELRKTADPSVVVVGEEVTFTLTLNNLGPSEATGVVVEDRLPTGISFVSATESAGSYNSSNGLWTVGTVAAGASPVLTLVGRVDTPGDKTNTAQVTAADQPDVDSTPNNSVENEDDQDSVTISAPQIDLSLVKVVDNSVPDVGEEIRFTLTLANAGPDTATNVQVRDQLPVGLSYLTSNTATGDYNPGTGVWNVGSVSPNSSVTLTIDATPTTTETLTNTAEVIAADQPDADSTPDNNDPDEDDQSSVMVGARQIDLELTKTVDNAAPNLNETVAFEIVVRNEGPSDASGVIVEDVLADGFVFVSSDPSLGNYNSGTGQWTVGNLAAEGSATLILRARVVDAVPLANTAEVVAADQVDRDSTPGNGVAEEDDQDSVDVIVQQADLRLTKTVDNPAPNVGQTATFTVTVFNQGPDPATNVTVADQLPAGITFETSAASQGGYNASTGVWTIGTIAPGSQVSLDLVGRIQTSGTKTNTAEVQSSDQFDPDSTPGNGIEDEDDQESVVITPPEIDLELSKTIDDDRVFVGQTIRYTLTVNNLGPDDATGVIIDDQLPTGVIFASSDATTGNYNSVSGRWEIDAIESGTSETLSIDVIVDTTVGTSNIAEVLEADQFDVDSVPGNGNPNEDDYAVAAFVLEQSDLSLTKDVDNASPNVGEDVIFTVTVNNSGPDPASGVTILDQLPAGLSYVTHSTTTGNYNASSGVWDLGNLATDGSATLTLRATSTTPTPVDNNAQVQTVDQLDPDSAPGNDQPGEDDQDGVRVTGQQIDLSVTKEVDEDRPNVGDQIQFTVTIDNDGPSTATGVVLRDLFPPSLRFISSAPNQGVFDSVSGLWNVGSIGAGNSATLTLTAGVDAILDVDNIAEIIAADQPDVDSTPANGNPEEDDQDASNVRTQVADLRLAKIVDDPTPDVGQRVLFSLELVNDGPDRATNIQIEDQLPEGLQYFAAVAEAGSYDAQSGIWSLDGLESGSSVTLTLAADVSSIGAKVNSAEVVAVDQADPDSSPGNNVASEDDQDSASVVPTLIDLSLEKTATPFRPSVNGQLVYTITIHNDGLDTATGIVVEDVLPDGVRLISANPSIGQYDAGNGHWSIESLPVGQDETLELVTTAERPGEFTNRTQVIAADQFDFDSTPGNDDGIDGNGNDEDDQAASTVTTASADLSLVKTVDEDRPAVGAEVTYRVEVTNGGPDAAENVAILDQIPTGLTFVSSTASKGFYDTATSIWSIPSIAEAEVVTLDLIVRVTSLGEKVNFAEVVASSEFDPDSTPANNEIDEDDMDSVSLTPELVDLALTKVVDAPSPNVNDLITFTLELTNQGPSDATGVFVKDLLPDGLDAQHVRPSQGVYDPTLGFWEVGDVPVGTRPTLEIDALVTSPDGTVNQAEVFAVDQVDIDSTPNNGPNDEDDFAEARVTPQVADLSLRQTVSHANPNRGEEVLFTVIVQNDGPNLSTNVVVRDILPDGLQFLRSTASSGDYDPGSGLWNIPSIPVGSVASLQLAATLEAKNAVSNVAEIIAADQLDPDSTPDNQIPTEDDIDATSVTPRLIDVSVAASVDNADPELNEVVEIVFEVTNSGPDDATGLVVEVDLPDGLELISSRPQRGTFNVSGSEETWNIGRLGEGETVRLVITARAVRRGDNVVNVEVIEHDQFDRDSDPGNGVPEEDDQTELLIRVPLFSKRLFLSGRR